MAPPRSQHPDHEDEKSHPIFYLFLSDEISCLPTPPPPATQKDDDAPRVLYRQHPTKN